MSNLNLNTISSLDTGREVDVNRVMQTVDYVGGLVIDSLDTVIVDGDNRYVLSASTTLPYTTTGAGMPEGGAFVSVGDAVLRQDLANPDKGASMVARGVVAVDSIADMLALPEGQRKEDLRYLVKGYHAGSDVGGGVFYWDPERVDGNDGGTVFAPVSGSDGRWVRQLDGFVTPEMFGAHDSAISDQRLPVQASITYGANNGLFTLLISKNHGISSSGLLSGGKLYGLMIPSNAKIISHVNTNLVGLGNEEFDIIVTNKDAIQNSENITLSGFTVDGNSFERTTNTGVNLAIHRVTNLKMRDVLSKNSTSFGWRIQSCDKVSLSFADSEQLDAAETNADGMHFIDTSNVTGSNLRIVTDSDDGFVIEAINGDVKNYTISDLYVRSKGRGVLLLVDETLTPESRLFKNIKISGIAENCLSSAVSLTDGSFEGVDIDIDSDGCRNGLTIKPGTSSNFGYLKSSKFNINTRNCTQQGMFAVVTTGVIDDNEINLNVYNPGDGFNGVQLLGSNWRGNVSCNYDPEGSKISPGAAVIFAASNSTVRLNAKGGANSVVMRESADNNNITVGDISGGSSNSLRIEGGSTGNNFFGGRISGAITNSGGSSNKFNGVFGASFYGLIRVSPDASGSVTISHNCSGMPTFASVNIISSLEIRAEVTALTNTTITAILRFASGGGPVTSGTYSAAIDVRL